MKKLVYFLLFFIIFAAQNLEAGMSNKKAVMVIAEENFRDEEFFQPKELLETAGVKVIVASSNTKLARRSEEHTSELQSH